MNPANERQNRAARPDMNTWLAANAGSGKTRVLTDRVARLLLAGTDPQKILCLTYTKAAAGEMQNRLFKRLGEWAMLGDSDLHEVLHNLGVEDQIDAGRLRRARTLFAKAIETPGGLKLQTIHSFCASLLRRFPLEAGVSPAFQEMDDRAADLLIEDVLNRMAEGPDRPLVEAVCRHVTDYALTGLVTAIRQNRNGFAQPFDENRVRQILNLPKDADAKSILDAVFQGGEAALFRNICPILDQHKATDIKGAQVLRDVTVGELDALPTLEKLFLFGEKTKTPFAARLEAFPTKICRESLAHHLTPLQDLMQRVETARPLRIGLKTLEKTRILHQFAFAFLAHVEAGKRAQGWLDFDDLIRITRQLLRNSHMADWILFKLDGGIDHILVDEAQDTSPDQWDIIETLAREFTSGESARDGKRTLFVVGDQKQSIYSFQGAEPQEFDRMRDKFTQRFRDAGTTLQPLTLEFSFRSSEVILRLVDLLFDGRGASGFAKNNRHKAFKSELPGRVDIWPVAEAANTREDSEWTDPEYRPNAENPNRILANRIADHIAELLSDGTTIPVDGPTPGTFARRPIRPGDFLILVQRRSELFYEIIRACKRRALPIAGADRLRVGAELAVRDLAALLRFLSTPEDSLSLAEALRSPLFGWSEQGLFDLAHKRAEPLLWQALRGRRAEFARTLDILDDLRQQADFLRPYDLIERMLTRHRGRANLTARLGAEAEDGINTLLSQALAYEHNQIPSLTGFLVWMQTNDPEIKRQSDTSGQLIRVMTVHGAKGLEAPIVLLPDTGVRRAPRAPVIVSAEGVPFWSMSKPDQPDALTTALKARQENNQRERDRLLYVALTRAEKWLIVAAAGKTGDVGESWYADIADAVVRAGGVPTRQPGGTGTRLVHLDWDALERVVSDKPDLPATAQAPTHAESAPRPKQITMLSPSDLGGAKALPGAAGDTTEDAVARGTHIHMLLEHLPRFDAGQRRLVAERLLPPSADPGLIDEAVNLLSAGHLQFLFSDHALVEVPVAAGLGEARIFGIIDRLVLSPGRVLAVDFKSNRVVPSQAMDCPEGLLRQLGAYAHALSAIYPDRSIETAIVWTHTGEFMPVPHDLVTAALANTGWVDGGQGRS